MAGYARYSGDPRWITCRWPGKCASCGAAMARGAQAFRYKTGQLYGDACGCGQTREHEFIAEAEDELAYGGAGGGMSW